MKARLALLRFNAINSFWFVPGLMLAGAIVLSVVTLELDRAFVNLRQEGRVWLFPIGAEGARLILSTIAGSMITVTSLVFSMTLVTLTMASAQLGPRLLRTFMEDSVNQVVLGIFCATFIYALLILRTVYGTSDGAFVPAISVITAMTLSVASVALLIYFIHHIATSIQADSVIAHVARQLDKTIDTLFPEQRADPKWATAADEACLPAGFEEAAKRIPVEGTGYVETVDYDGIFHLAAAHDLIVRLECRPGHFLIDAGVAASAWPGDHVNEAVATKIRAAIVLGPTRTAAQDPEFAAKALVEVALRALSPGINDEFTAIACIDRLGGSLARVMRRDAPPAARMDDSGKLRLLTDPITVEGLFDSAFNQIRQAARDHVAITIRLIETLTGMSAFIQGDAHYQAIKKHRDMIERSSAEFTFEPIDRRDVAQRLKVLDDALGDWRRNRQADGEPTPVK
ncbi:DUF2254 domain-containing protein [Rhodospirillaceae bacterium SYSU D60014]|uniref:DUF2254 domain-containing protein n=1 Tax=Virgifigura deserti TaxID=2268457 RepID=UPI000E66D48B